MAAYCAHHGEAFGGTRVGGAAQRRDRRRMASPSAAWPSICTTTTPAALAACANQSTAQALRQTANAKLPDGQGGTAPTLGSVRRALSHVRPSRTRSELGPHSSALDHQHRRARCRCRSCYSLSAAPQLSAAHHWRPRCSSRGESRTRSICGPRRICGCSAFAQTAPSSSRS